MAATLNRLADLDYLTLYLNSIKDIRSDGNVSTNGKGAIELRCHQRKVTNLLDVDVSDYHTIGVDEGQFFDDIREAVVKWMNMGKQVYVAGLDGDYRQQPFGKILDLVPLCSAGCLEKLKALCMVCRKQGLETEAGYTRRIAAPSGSSVIDIGGTDKYQAVCWRHLHGPIPK